MTGLVGETGHVKLLETTVLDCDGTRYGPFDVSADATWSTTDTSVVTVGSVTSSGVLCTYVGGEQANVHADFLGTFSEPDPLGSGCETTFVPFEASCPVQVFTIDSILPETLNVSTGDMASAHTLQVSFTPASAIPTISFTFTSLHNLGGTTAANLSVPSKSGTSPLTITVKASPDDGSGAFAVRRNGLKVRDALSTFLGLDERKGRILWIARTKLARGELTYVYFPPAGKKS
jgi:hypothetical protein